MKANRLAWALILLAALGLYLFENNTGTRALLAAALLLPLLGAAYLYLPRWSASAALTAPELPRRGAAAEGLLRLETTAALPLPRVSVAVRIRNRLTGEAAALQASAALRGREARDFPFSLRAEHCGVLELSVAELRLTDPLGLFTRILPADARRTALVPPEPYPVDAALAETEALWDGEEYSAQRPGWDPGETFRIREYVPGDPIRQIHWKLSEKSGRTLVRDFGLPIASRMLLLLDASPAASPGTLDGMLDLLFSLSEALLRAEIPHTVGWGTYAELEINAPGDLDALRDALLSGPPGGAVRGFLERHAGCAFAHVAVLADTPVPDAARLGRGGRVTLLLPADADAPERASDEVETVFYTPETMEFVL